MYLKFKGHLTDVVSFSKDYTNDKGEVTSTRTFYNGKLRSNLGEYEYINVGIQLDPKYIPSDDSPHDFTLRVHQTWKGDKNKGETPICLLHLNIVQID